LHSPNVSKVEILRRAKVRRNFLSYLRQRRGKSARLQEISFDKAAANAANDVVKAVDEDVETTEIDPEQETDALNDAQPLDEEVKEEQHEAREEDDVQPNEDVDQQDEADLPEIEVEEGLDRAEPGEGKAV
jgi:hypothetical protein